MRGRSWSLLAGAVGHEPMAAPLTPEAADSELVLDLVRSSLVKGVVLGAGGPVAGVTVSVTGAARKGTTAAVSDETDAGGRFALFTGAGPATRAGRSCPYRPATRARTPKTSS